MNERFKKIFNDFVTAYENLNSACKNAKTDLEIDGAIKRFELCYELGWKLIKGYLANLGIICKNPRNCFKEAYNNDLISDKEQWLNMIEDRNLLVHTYNFKNSRTVFNNIKNNYVHELKVLLRSIKNEE